MVAIKSFWNPKGKVWYKHNSDKRLGENVAYKGEAPIDEDGYWLKPDSDEDNHVEIKGKNNPSKYFEEGWDK